MFRKDRMEGRANVAGGSRGINPIASALSNGASSEAELRKMIMMKQGGSLFTANVASANYQAPLRSTPHRPLSSIKSTIDLPMTSKSKYGSSAHGRVHMKASCGSNYGSIAGAVGFSGTSKIHPFDNKHSSFNYESLTAKYSSGGKGLPVSKKLANYGKAKN